MSHKLELLDGAYIISDAHYSHSRVELFSLIEDISSKKLLPSQLILMGDIFDALFGEIPHTHNENSEIINLINEISLEIEVVYLEGNHDFNLRKIFPNSKVIPFSQQPCSFMFKDKSVSLAHGDFDISFLYKLYTFLIRSSIVLYFLKLINVISFNAILNKLDKHLSKKEDCNEFVGFKEYIYERSLQKYESDYFIEGHYHQNIAFEFENLNYINLAAFACNQRYFIVKSLQDNKLFLEEKSYKEI